MKVKDVMVATPVSCSLETNAGAAVEILWNQNCGILPILDSQQKVVGVVTDRDLCIALGTRNRLPGEIRVRDITCGEVVACKPNDDIHTALATMARAKVRRLPVIDANDRLEGVLSMDDVVFHSETRTAGMPSELSHDDVVKTLKGIYQPELAQVAERRMAAA